MRRFSTGTTDQYLYFVAVDATDLTTRETGLTAFTVYRSRNGAAATAYTTPTIIELSGPNMPGVYALLLDEDMTIGAGNDSEEVCLHITCSGMAPVTLVYELYTTVLDDAVETSLTVRQAMRLFAAALLGKASGLATTTATFRDTNDTKNRIVATVDASGNRTAVTYDKT